MSDYVYQEFPKWKYHPKLSAKLVQNAEEENSLLFPCLFESGGDRAARHSGSVHAAARGRVPAAERGARGIVQTCLTFVCFLLSLLLLGHLAGLVFDLLARRRPA